MRVILITHVVWFRKFKCQPSTVTKSDGTTNGKKRKLIVAQVEEPLNTITTKCKTANHDAVAVMQPLDYVAVNKDITALKERITDPKAYIFIRHAVLSCLKIENLKDMYLMSLLRAKVLRWAVDEHITFLLCIIGMPIVELQLFACLPYLSHVRIIFLLGHHSAVTEDDFKMQMKQSLKLLNEFVPWDQKPFQLPERNYVAIYYPGEKDEHVEPRYIYYFIRNGTCANRLNISEETLARIQESCECRSTDGTSQNSCHTTPLVGLKFILALLTFDDRILDIGYGTSELLLMLARRIRYLNWPPNCDLLDNHVYGFGTEMETVFKYSGQIDGGDDEVESEESGESSGDEESDCSFGESEIEGEARPVASVEEQIDQYNDMCSKIAELKRKVRQIKNKKKNVSDADSLQEIIQLVIDLE